MLSFSSFDSLHAESKDLVITSAAVGKSWHILPEITTCLTHLCNVWMYNVHILPAELGAKTAEVDECHAAHSWYQVGQCKQQQQHQPQQSHQHRRRHLEVQQK